MQGGVFFMALKQKDPIPSVFLRFFFALMLGLLAAALALAGFAALMAAQGLAQPAAWPLATVAGCVGALCGGFTFARMQKNKGLLCGGAQGICLGSLLLAATVVGDNALVASQWARIALFLLCGSIGGCAGVWRAEKAQRKH
jgi:putative membrane protein (TIGR04086 family)